jgi:lipopolysaccharide biosynthesis glycosyltransferase
MIVCHDVAELYNIDLEGNILGAVRDPIISGSNKSPAYNKRDDMEKLGIKNIYDYFQAGVLLIDLKKISENGLCDRMIEYAATHDCDLVDQDVLNLFCQGRVKFIDNKWNVDVNNIAVKVVPYAPAAMWKEYRKNRECAYIYHFAGADKPWNNPALDKADIFWNTARKTSWYEIILEDLIGSSVFFRRSVIPKNSDTMQEIIKIPDDLAKLTIPIMRAYNEMSALGMADILIEGLKKTDDELFLNKTLIFYGAGNCCRRILVYFDKIGIDYPDAIWDRAAKRGERLFGVPILPPDFESLNGREDVLCVITIESQTTSTTVKRQFNKNGFTNTIENKDVMRILSRKLWLKLEKESQPDKKLPKRG